MDIISIDKKEKEKEKNVCAKSASKMVRVVIVVVVVVCTTIAGDLLSPGAGISTRLVFSLSFFLSFSLLYERLSMHSVIIPDANVGSPRIVLCGSTHPDVLLRDRVAAAGPVTMTDTA